MCGDTVLVVCHSIVTSIMSTTSFLLCTKHYVVVTGVGVAMYGVATYSHVYMCFEQYASTCMHTHTLLGIAYANTISVYSIPLVHTHSMLLPLVHTHSIHPMESHWCILNHEMI